MPSLRVVGEVNKIQDTKEICARARALVGSWKECIDAELINQFMLLKWRLSRDIDDMANIWASFNENDRYTVVREGESALTNSFNDDILTQSYVESDFEGKEPSESDKESIGPLSAISKNLHWNLSVEVENSSITVRSPALDVVFKTGDMSFFLKDAPPVPGVVIPFSWKVNIMGIRLAVKDKRQHWGNLVSNIVIRVNEQKNNLFTKKHFFLN